MKHIKAKSFILFDNIDEVIPTKYKHLEQVLLKE